MHIPNKKKVKIAIPKSLQILANLAHCSIFITGGFVRNHLVGLGSTDIDIAGSALPEAFLGSKKINKNFSVTEVNKRLGTLWIKCRETGELFEYTPFRTESYGEGGVHTPEEVAFTTDMLLDAKRRDFCCNALYYDIKNSEVIDFFGGIEDCEKKMLRCWDAKYVFADDGLRLLRLARISAETGFLIDNITKEIAISFRHHLNDITAERKRIELERILVADTKYSIKDAHYRGLKLLYELQLFKYLIPELLEGDRLEQNKEHHIYDVLEHTFQVVRFSPPEVRLSALLHDVGKPYALKEFGKMAGHADLSEKLVRKILGSSGLKFSNEKIDETARLCKHHMVDKDGNMSEQKLIRFAVKNWDILDKLIALIDADRLGANPNKQHETHRLVAIKQKIIDTNVPLTLKDLKINGSDLLAVGITGQNIGKILTEIHDHCILNSKLNTRDWQLEFASRFNI